MSTEIFEVITPLRFKRQCAREFPRSRLPSGRRVGRSNGSLEQIPTASPYWQVEMASVPCRVAVPSRFTFFSKGTENGAKNVIVCRYVPILAVILRFCVNGTAFFSTGNGARHGGVHANSTDKVLQHSDRAFVVSCKTRNARPVVMHSKE